METVVPEKTVTPAAPAAPVVAGKAVAKKATATAAPQKAAAKKAAAPAPAAKAAKPVTKTIAEPAVKPTAKAATKPVAKSVKVEKVEKVEKAAKPVKVAKPAKEAKLPKPEKADKLVRDSFTIPRAEYALLQELKLRSATLGRPAKKSEVLRAGIQALKALDNAALLAVLGQVPVIKTGRPTGE